MADKEKKYKIKIEADGSKALREVEKVRKELAKAGTPNPTDQQVTQRLREKYAEQSRRFEEQQDKTAHAQRIARHAKYMEDEARFGRRKAIQLMRQGDAAGVAGNGGMISNFLQNRFGMSPGMANRFGSFGNVSAGVAAVAQAGRVAGNVMTDWRETGSKANAIKQIPGLASIAEGVEGGIEAFTGDKYEAQRMARMGQLGEEFMRNRLAFKNQLQYGRMGMEASAAGTFQAIAGLRARGSERDRLGIISEQNQAIRASQLSQLQQSDAERARFQESKKAMEERQYQLKQKQSQYGLSGGDESELRDLNQKLESMAKDHQAKLAQIEAEGNQTRSQANAIAAEKERQRQKEIYEESRVAQRKIMADQSEFQANSLKLRGMGFEADLKLTKDAYQRRIQEIADQERLGLKANPERAQQIREAANAQRGLAGQAFAFGNLAAKESEISRRQGVQSDLAGQMSDSLRNQAKMGRKGAFMQAERLDVQQQFAGRRGELEKLLRDPTASQTEKDIARQQLAGLGAEESQAIRMAGYRGPSGGLSGSTDNSYGTGIAEAASERSSNGMDRVALASEETNRILAQLLSLMATNLKPPQPAGMF